MLVLARRLFHRQVIITYAGPPPSATAAIPTLGNTGIKFNSSRWTTSGDQMGLSVFDTKGAMECIQNVRSWQYNSVYERSMSSVHASFQLWLSDALVLCAINVHK